MKVGVCADTHVGRAVPRVIGDLRRQAYRHAFTQAMNVFIEEEVDAVVHAGDLFEKRSMTPEDSLFVKDEFQRLVDKIRERTGREVKIFVIRGNHDGTPENSVLDYVEHPLARYLHVVGDGLLQGRKEVYVNGNLRLVGIGYHPYIAQKFQAIKPLIEEALAEGDELKVLVVHNFVKGYHKIPPGVPEHNVYTVGDFAGIRADFIIVGHDHGKRDPWRDNGRTMLTPGATEAVDMSDKGPYGVFIIDDDRKARFIPIKPLHEVRNIEVDSEGAVNQAEWFIKTASEKTEAYASSLQASGSQGILRVVLSGLTDGEPYAIEQALIPRLGDIRQAAPRLLHIELVNNVETVQQTVTLPAFGGGAEYAAKILEPLGDAQGEGVTIVEEVSNALDEKASRVTGLLTGTDREAFVRRWIELLEKGAAKT